MRDRRAQPRIESGFHEVRQPLRCEHRGLWACRARELATAPEPLDRLLQSVFHGGTGLPPKRRPGVGDVGLAYGGVVLWPCDELDRRPGPGEVPYPLREL